MSYILVFDSRIKCTINQATHNNSRSSSRLTEITERKLSKGPLGAACLKGSGRTHRSEYQEPQARDRRLFDKNHSKDPNKISHIHAFNHVTYAYKHGMRVYTSEK